MGVVFFVLIGYEVFGEFIVIGLLMWIGFGKVEVGDEVVVFCVSGGYVGEFIVFVEKVFVKLLRLMYLEVVNLLFVGMMVVEMLVVMGVVLGEIVLFYGVLGVVGVSVL